MDMDILNLEKHGQNGSEFLAFLSCRCRENCRRFRRMSIRGKWTKGLLLLAGNKADKNMRE
jgi:hypothetical protein